MKLKIVNASTSESMTPFWGEMVYINRLIGSGSYPVVATIEIDDRFIDDSERDDWIRSVIRQWAQIAGCARRGIYVGVADGKTVATTVAGCPREPWVVVRGDDDRADLCRDGTENDQPVLWYQTEEEAQAAAARYVEQLTQIGREENAPENRVASAINSLSVRVVEASDKWDWAFEQMYASSHRCRIIDDMAIPYAD